MRHQTMTLDDEILSEVLLTLYRNFANIVVSLAEENNLDKADSEAIMPTTTMS